MAGPMTITCPGCRESFPVPVQVVRVVGHAVLCRIDRSELYGHLAACPGMTGQGSPEQEASKAVAVPDDKLPDVELTGRIHLLLAGGHFMAKGGSGACTMCGVHRDACLELVKASGPTGGHPVGPACCNACRDGNTHPAPMESRGTCAEWGAEHGAKA